LTVAERTEFLADSVAIIAIERVDKASLA